MLNIDYIYELSKVTEQMSNCVSRKVVAIIFKDDDILEIATNGVPYKLVNCKDSGECKRRALGFKSGEGMDKCIAEHAESNAISRCAKYGKSTNGAFIFINTPLKAPIKYIRANIFKFSFKFLFVLNNTNIASPLPVNTAAIDVPRDNTFFRYNSVSITLDAQFGISPNKLDIKGAKVLFFKNIFDSSFSST